MDVLVKNDPSSDDEPKFQIEDSKPYAQSNVEVMYNADSLQMSTEQTEFTAANLGRDVYISNGNLTCDKTADNYQYWSYQDTSASIVSSCVHDLAKS